MKTCLLYTSKREVLDTQKSREEDITHSYDNTYSILLDYVEQKKKSSIEFDSISALLNTKEYQELSDKLNALMKIIAVSYTHLLMKFRM